MSGGVPKRVSISRTQRNTPSKAGNPVPKNAIILCNGGQALEELYVIMLRKEHTPKPKKKKRKMDRPDPTGPMPQMQIFAQQ